MSVLRSPSSARLIFMGTPAFALPTLQTLCESQHDIVAVYTQPPRPAGRGQKESPSPVHAYAEAKGIPVFTPVSLKDEATQQQFASHKADAAIVVAYGLLLPQPILQATPLGCINVHPSLLPRWRGAAPIQRAIMAGDTETGICIMQMDEGLDTGDVLIRKDVTLPKFIDAGGLHDMLAEQAGPLVLQALDGLQHSRITPQPQSEGGVTYANKITKEECRIDWSQPAEAIHNQIRGLSPAPGAYFVYNGEKIKVFGSSFSPSDKHFADAQPGQVMTNHLDIKCGTGVLTPDELQRPGKKRLMSVDFLAGFGIAAGSQLE